MLAHGDEALTISYDKAQNQQHFRILWYGWFLKVLRKIPCSSAGFQFCLGGPSADEASPEISEFSQVTG
jgi:hypothetical protein